jgi:hypothetical protein
VAASVRERSPARRSPRRRVDLTSIELSGLGGAVGEDLLALGQPVAATKLGLAPTSIEVRQAAFTVAEQVTSSPTWTGRMNVIRSTAAVTTRLRQWRIAAIPATSSQSFMTTPP